MRRVLVTSVAVVALFVLVSSPLAADEIDITVSPNIINIASASTVVTVHTDIAYSVVDTETEVKVTLNGIEIDWWKSDNQGNFVAKFVASEVKGIVEADSTATLTLSGVTKTFEEFSGSDEVDVIDKKKEK